MAIRHLFAPQLWLSLLLVPIVGCMVHVHGHSGTSHGGFEATSTSTSGSQLPERDKLLFQYQPRDGQAALESERVVLVFHGLSPEQQRVFHFQGKQQALQIAGPGMCSVSTTCSSGKATIRFCSDYANGTNTLQFGQHKVRLTHEGRLLLAGDQSVDLSERRKIIHLKGDKVELE